MGSSKVFKDGGDLGFFEAVGRVPVVMDEREKDD